ncbi:hypothetical protein CBR_g33936, partial [Chara braunii]
EQLVVAKKSDAAFRTALIGTLSLGMNILDALRPQIFSHTNSCYSLRMRVSDASDQSLQRATGTSSWESLGAEDPWHLTSGSPRGISSTESGGGVLFDGKGGEFNGNLENAEDMREALTGPGGELEALLNVYFDMFRLASSTDRTTYGTVVAQLADFLAHCVVAQGRVADIVLLQRSSLERIGQAFPGIKKLKFVLSLLDEFEASTLSKQGREPACQNGVAREISGFNSAATSSQPTGRLASSMVQQVPVGEVLAVRKRLIHLSGWNPSHMAQMLDTQWPSSRLFSRRESLTHSIEPYTEDMEGTSQEKGENTEDSLPMILKDIDRASARLPAILLLLEDVLIGLTAVNDTGVREAAYNLLYRILAQNNSEASVANIALCVLSRIRDPDMAIARSAICQASRFYHYCPDHQEAMIVEMLRRGRAASEELRNLLRVLFTVDS